MACGVIADAENAAQDVTRASGTRHGAMDVARKTSEIEVLWNGCLRKAANLGDLVAYK